MVEYRVAAVQDWDESRMAEDFENVTGHSHKLSFATGNYKTLRGLIMYRIQEDPVYHGHVWAVFYTSGPKEMFVGLEYNLEDASLQDLARRYMRVRNRLRKTLTSAYPLSVRA